MAVLFFFTLIFGFFGIYVFTRRHMMLRKFRVILQNDGNFAAKKLHEIADTFQKNDRTLLFISNFDKNISLKLLCTAVIFFIFYAGAVIFGLDPKRETLALAVILIFVFFIIAPGFVKNFIIEKRIRAIDANLPIFVDLLAVCVQAGMSIENAIKYLQGAMSSINAAFSPFLGKLIARMEISGLEVALINLQQELPSKPISMMCNTLRQSLKYGSKIYDSLIGLSAEIRESSLLQTEEAIGKISAKLSIPLILFFMFPVIVVIAAPGVMRVLGGVV